MLMRILGVVVIALAVSRVASGDDSPATSQPAATKEFVVPLQSGQYVFIAVADVFAPHEKGVVACVVKQISSCRVDSSARPHKWDILLTVTPTTRPDGLRMWRWKSAVRQQMPDGSMLEMVSSTMHTWPGAKEPESLTIESLGAKKIEGAADLTIREINYNDAIGDAQRVIVVISDGWEAFPKALKFPQHLWDPEYWLTAEAWPKSR